MSTASSDLTNELEGQSHASTAAIGSSTRVRPPQMPHLKDGNIVRKMPSLLLAVLELRTVLGGAV